DYAFASCTNMTTAIINFPNNSGMGNNIFYNCKALTTATLNSKIIGSEMFDQCVKLKTLKMTGVEVIEYCAFNGCTLLTSITLPTTVKTIKANAFSSSSFRTINLNDGLETIGDNAFSGCTYLQELKIPEGITVIPSGAFANCVFLTKLYIPSTVTDINLSAFNQCKSLAEIIIDKNNPKYVVVDGVVYTIEDDESRTFFYCPLAWDESERLTVPEGSTSIPAGAFKNNQTIVNVTIPATVTSIGASAFEGCARLRSVTFEEGSVLTSIGDKAFYKCGDLNRLTFTGDTVLQSIGSQAFYSCSDLTGLYFENNTKDISIGNNAFNGATKFTGFFNGSDQANLGNIGTDAFWNCTALEYVRLGQSVSSLARIHYSGYEYNPFYGCTSLKAFEMEGDSNDYCYVNDGVLFLKSYTTNTTTDSAQDLQNVLYCYPYAREAYTYTVPDGTQGIGESAFRYNNTLEEIIFAESVSVIDDFAFDDCARLSKIDGMKMQYINRYAFSDCVRLEEADLSQTTEKTLQSDVFYRCTSLKKAVLPSTVTKVAPYAFYNCYNLTDLNLSDEITFVGSRAFYGCYKWQQAKVPAAISGAIGDYAFYNCDYIESINIPAGVTSIGERAFADLRSLSSLTFEEGISLTSIGECAFMSAPNIKKVVIPEGVTTLGGGVFLSCTALEEVSLPSSLTTMSGSYRLTTDNEYAYGNYARYGSYIFARDKALRRIVINNPKLSVPKYMFFDSGTTPTIYIYSADSEEEGSVKNWASSYSEGCFNPVWVDITKYDTELDPYYSGGSTVEIPVSGHFTVVMDNHENEFTWDYNKDTKTVTIDGTGILSVEYLKNYDNEDDDIILGLFGEGEEEPDTLWSAYYRDEVEHVILSDRITGLGPFTFMNHTALKYVDYGTLTLIGYEAFYGCRALTEFDFKSGLKEIGYEAFYNCNALESVVLPESLETMGNYVFESCHNLKTAEFLGTAQTPSSLKMLPYGSFSNCEKLERLTIGEGVETLTSIYGCTGLTTLNLPVSLTELDLNLEDLTALTTITVTEGSEHFKVIEGCLYGYIDGSWSFIWGRMERETDQGKVLYISENMTGINFPSLALKKNYARVIVEEGNSQYMEVDNAVYSKDGKTLYLVPSLAEGEDGVFNIAPGTKTIGTYAFS
ncbi:MAG: leucine-rich repeat domain-containing protein, partial [Butyrivibrio sp.]|nr:leucine-rich repeat domain-containing protein [Butyrivibrio sp.]